MFYYLDHAGAQTRLNSEARKCLKAHVEPPDSMTFICIYVSKFLLTCHEMLAHGSSRLLLLTETKEFICQK